MNQKTKRKRERMIALLEDTTSHYNSNNRSVKVDREYQEESCIYIPIDPNLSEGCAIGRKLSAKAKKFILEEELNSASWEDALFESGLKNFDPTPRCFSGLNIKFVYVLQGLHDSERFWNEEGLSKDGEKEKNYILTNINQGLYD